VRGFVDGAELQNLRRAESPCLTVSSAVSMRFAGLMSGGRRSFMRELQRTASLLHGCAVCEAGKRVAAVKQRCRLSFHQLHWMCKGVFFAGVENHYDVRMRQQNPRRRFGLNRQEFGARESCAFFRSPEVLTATARPITVHGLGKRHHRTAAQLPTFRILPAFFTVASFNRSVAPEGH